MLDTDKYLIPGLIYGSVINAVVHPIPLAATTATSRSVMVVARLRCLGVRNGRVVEKKRIAVGRRSACTDSSHPGSSLCYLPR